MIKVKKKKGPVIPGFPDKWSKKLQAGLSEQGLADFLGEVDAMVEDDIKATIVKCNKVSSSTENDKEDDANLKMAQDRVKDLREPYDTVITCQKAKIKYLIHVMNQRGYA